MVGGLAVAIGVTLGASAAAERRSRDAAVLGIASGVAFGFADVQAAVASSRIYLGDAALRSARGGMVGIPESRQMISPLAAVEVGLSPATGPVGSPPRWRVVSADGVVFVVVLRRER